MIATVQLDYAIYKTIILYCTVILYCTLELHCKYCTVQTEIVEEEWELAGTLAAGTSSGAPVVCAVGWNSWYLVCPTPSQPLPQEEIYTAGRGAPAEEWCTIRSPGLPVSSCRKAQDVRWWLRDLCERRHRGLQKPTPQAEQDTVDLCRPVGCG